MISEICYCPKQVEWLINEFLVVEGRRVVMGRFTWPDEKAAENAGETPRTNHFNRHSAPYERICQVVGELSERLEKCEKDGRLLVLEVRGDKKLSQDAKNAMYYSSSRWRKRMRYGDWLKQRQYRRRERN